MIPDPSPQKLKWRTLISGVLGSAAILGATAFFIHEGNAFFRGMIGKRLLEISWLLSRQIDADAHATIRTPEDMESDAYRKLSASLEGVQQDAAPQVSKVMSAYTVRIAGGDAFLIVSPPADLNRNGRIDGELEEREPVGLPYGQPPDEAMRTATVEGVPKVVSAFTTDRWGTWLTACAPLKTKSGALDGAVCVDEDARDVQRSLFAVNLMTIAVSLLIAFLFGSTLIGYLKARLELAARVSAEWEQQRALQRFEMAIASTPFVAVQSIDQTGTVGLWNHASEKICGFTREEALGADLPALILPEPERSEFQKEIERVWITKRPSPSRKWTIQTKSGGARQILSTIFPIIVDGEIVEAFCMGVDISREVTAKQDLEKGFERLQSLCQLMVGRESRVVELKKEINELCDQLGVPRRFGLER